MPDIFTSNKFLIAVLFVACFLVYGRTINYDFVWDDQRSHLNAHEDLMNGKVGKMWGKTYDGMYIPVTYTTWYALKEIAWNGKELNPKPFHCANVFVHSLNVILLFLILLLLFRNSPAAFVGSLLFAFHPLQTESVAWISEFRGLYSCFFSFLAIYILLKHIGGKAVTGAMQLIQTRAYILATVLFLCALFSKPSAVILPFIVMLLCWCFYRKSFSAACKTMIAWILIALPVVFSTGSAQSNELLSFVVPITSRPLLTGYSIWFYLAKFFVPVNLAPSYGLTPGTILDGNMALIFTIVVTGIGILLFMMRERLKVVFTGFLFFLISILPVTGIISFHFQRYSNVADRYVYFGMTGFAMIVAYLWTISGDKKYIRYIAGGFLFCCLVLTINQTPVWENEFAMWNDSMEKYPDQFMAAYNRGVSYGKKNQPGLAIADYNIAIQYNSRSKDAYVNRANELAKLNRFGEALKDYEAAIAIAPNDGSIYYNRALMNYNAGNFDSCPADIIKAQDLGFPIDMTFATAVRNAMHH